VIGSYRRADDCALAIGASFAPIINTGLSGLNAAEGQIFACLRAHSGEIVNAERTFRVTRLAISGAIAWEMLENVRKCSPR
jgi:hypothetical protein